MIFLFCIHLMNLYIFEAFYLQDLDPHLSMRIRIPEAFLNVDPCGSGWFFTILKKNSFRYIVGQIEINNPHCLNFTLFFQVWKICSVPDTSRTTISSWTTGWRPWAAYVVTHNMGQFSSSLTSAIAFFRDRRTGRYGRPSRCDPPPTHHQQGPRVWCQWHAVMQCEEIHPPHPPTADWAKLALNQFYLNICRYCNWNLLVAVIVPGIVL